MNSTSLSSELIVYYGAVPNDGTGDPLRDAFIKTQTNINYLFNFLNNNPYYPNATIGNAFITAANISTLTTTTSNATIGNAFITAANISTLTTTTLNASNLVISDSIVYLADSNPSDLLTIGMVADYNTNGIGGNVHTGLVRSSVTKEWYLFDNYGPNDPQSLVNFDLISSNINLSTLNANTVTQAPNDNSNKLASTAYVDKLSYYDIAGGSTGSPTASAKLLTFVAVRNMSLPTNLTGSYCVAGTAATATTTITLNKNGSSFGTISFAAAATIATFTVAATSFIAGDIITVVAPATPDTTLADIGFTLTGTL